MAKIADPVLPTLSILGYWEPFFWALLEVFTASTSQGLYELFG